MAYNDLKFENLSPIKFHSYKFNNGWNELNPKRHERAFCYMMEK